MTLGRARANALGGLAFLVALAWAGPAASLVSYDRVVYVTAALEDAPWASASTELASAFAETRLGYRPDKVLTPEGVQSLDDLTRYLRKGEIQRVLHQDDLVVLHLVGRPSADAAALERWVRRVPSVLRRRDMDVPGLFEGAALVVTDEAPVPSSVRPADTVAWLAFGASEDGPSVVSDRTLAEPARADPMAGQAVASCGSPCRDVLSDASGVTRGVLDWLAALEELAARGDDGAAHARALAESASDARFVPPASYRTEHFRLFLRELTLQLFVGDDRSRSREVLRKLQDAVEERASKSTRRVLDIVGERANPIGPFVWCEVTTTPEAASFHCEDDRKRRVYDAQDVDVSILSGTLEELANQLLGRYESLEVDHGASLQSMQKPAFAVFLVDNSLSMAYNDPTSTSDPTIVVDESKREVAALRLIDALGRQAEGLGESTRFGLVTFSASTKVASFGDRFTVELDGPPSPEEQRKLAEVIEGAVGYGGATNLLAPLRKAHGLVEQFGEGHESHVILLTDGRDTMGEPEARRKQILSEAESLNSLGASIHTVGLTEEQGRLSGYLQRLREEGETYDTYLELYSRDVGSGEWHAEKIEETGFYDPKLLDALRQGGGKVQSGAFIQPRSAAGFQKAFEEIVTMITGGGVYASRTGVRRQAPFDADVVVDHWQFDLALRSEARILLYNPDGVELVDDPWKVTRNGDPVEIGEDVEFNDVGETVTELVIPAPAKGVWRISRKGRLP